MSDKARKLGPIAGAVIFGGFFGVVSSSEARNELASTNEFATKLQILSQALSSGEIKPLIVDRRGDWTSGPTDDLRVADWLQTWSKWSKDSGSWGKV